MNIEENIVSSAKSDVNIKVDNVKDDVKDEFSIPPTIVETSSPALEDLGQALGLNVCFQFLTFLSSSKILEFANSNSLFSKVSSFS